MQVDCQDFLSDRIHHSVEEQWLIYGGREEIKTLARPITTGGSTTNSNATYIYMNPWFDSALI